MEPQPHAVADVGFDNSNNNNEDNDAKSNMITQCLGKSLEWKPKMNAPEALIKNCRDTLLQVIFP